MLSDEYLAWNQAIAETIYSPRAAGTPVYLDLDDEILAEIATHPSLKSHGKSKEDLARVVASTIDWQGNKNSLLMPIVLPARSWMTRFLKNENPDGYPPMIAFLAVAVLAAEAMGNGEASPNAYYAQLFQILGVSEESSKKALEAAYRDWVLSFWGILRKWLTEKEWALGIPTAEALSHPYVSVAVSQALVREADRRKLGRMFDFMGFRPGEFISPNDMADYFAIWAQREDSHLSNAIRALWKKASARERISEVLSQQLQAWDGSVLGANADKPAHGNNRPPQASKLRLAVKVSSFLGKKTLSHTLLFSSSFLAAGQDSSFYATSSPEIPLSFSQKGRSFATLDNPEVVPLGALLVGDIQVISKGHSINLRRVPRDVVVLSFDDDLQRFVETERASLGAELLVLVRDENQLIAKLQKVLNENARPGFRLLAPDTAGIPSGWVAVTDIQLVSAQTPTFELRQFEALTPLTSSQLTLAGGLKIPGAMSARKYLASRAPEVRAISQVETNIAVHLFESVWSDEGFADRLVSDWQSSNGTLFVDLAQVISAPGDYKVIFFEGSSPTMQRDFYMRNGDIPDPVSLRSMPKLVHSFEESGADASWAAAPLEEGCETFIYGATSNYTYESDLSEPAFATTIGSWDVEERLAQGSAQETVVVPPVDSDSCILTGKHRRELPMCTDGAKYVLGVCSTCGEARPECCDAYLVKKKKAYENMAKSRTAQVVEPVNINKENSLDWAEVYELFSHAVHGSAQSMLSALDSLEFSQYSSSQILDVMEQLGHIEVTRKPSGLPESWAMVAGSVRINSDAKSARLLGLWPRAERGVIESLGLQIATQSQAPGFEIQLGNEAESAKEALAEAGVEITDDSEIVRALLGLSWTIESSERLPLPNLETLDFFDFKSGAWQPSEVLKPGAIRVKTPFGFRYYFLGSDDVGKGMGVPTSATISKYMAANQQSVRLIKYSTQRNSMIVPLGARIPGLYGRAVLSNSGCLPQQVELTIEGRKFRALEYPNVSIELATNISRLLAD